MEQILNILVAEDNSDDLFLLQQAFKKGGITSRLHAVENGVEVLAYFKGEERFADRGQYPIPEILLLDLNMPNMNGFEVLQWLRQHPRFGNLVVHVLTASARVADIQRAYELRANSYIIKPSRMDELITCMSALYQWHRFTAFPPLGETRR